MKDKLVILFVFCVLCAFNWVFPFQSDDMAHYFSAINPQTTIFSTYFNWNGRFGEMLYSGFFAAYNQTWWIKILNAGVGTFFIFAFFKVIFARLPQSQLDFLSLGLICLMLVNMDFAAIFLWGAGSFNYLWGMSLIVGFLMGLRLFWGNCFGENNQIGYWKFLTLLFAIPAGWSSEHIGATLCCVLVLSLFFAWYRKIKLPWWYYVGAVGFIVGWLILFNSPGSAKRAKIFLESGGFIPLKEFFKMSLIDQILRFNSAWNAMYSRGFSVFILLFCYFYLYKTKRQFKLYQYILCGIVVILAWVFVKHISATLVYFAILFLMILLTRREFSYILWVGLFAVWMLIGATTFQIIWGLPLRARFGDGLILATLVVLMFQEVYLKSAWKTWIQRGLWIGLGGSVILCFANWAFVGYQWKKLENYIQEQKKQGNLEIVVSKDYFKSYYLKDWSEPNADPKWWVNGIYAQYFEIKSLSVQ